MSTFKLLLLALALSGCSDPQDRGITGAQLERLWEINQQADPCERTP